MKNAKTKSPYSTTLTTTLAGITSTIRKSTAARFILVASGTATRAGYSGTSTVLNGGNTSVRRKTYAFSRVLVRNKMVTRLRVNAGTRPVKTAANHPITTQTKAAMAMPMTTTPSGMARIARSSTVQRRCFARSGSSTRSGSGSVGGMGPAGPAGPGGGHCGDPGGGGVEGGGGGAVGGGGGHGDGWAGVSESAGGGAGGAEGGGQFGSAGVSPGGTDGGGWPAWSSGPVIGPRPPGGTDLGRSIVAGVLDNSSNARGMSPSSRERLVCRSRHRSWHTHFVRPLTQPARPAVCPASAASVPTARGTGKQARPRRTIGAVATDPRAALRGRMRACRAPAPR